MMLWWPKQPLFGFTIKRVTSTLKGAKNTDQLASNLRAAEIELTANDLQSLDEVSAVPARYPF